MQPIIIKCTNEDFRNVRFLHPHRIIIKDYLIQFPNEYALENYFIFAGNQMGEEGLTVANFTSIQKATEDDLSNSMCFYDAYKQAIDKSVLDMADSVDKLGRKIDFPLALETVGLWDLLFISIRETTSSDKDDIFSCFIACAGGPWTMHFLPVEDLLKLYRYFFDRAIILIDDLEKYRRGRKKPR